MMIAIVQARMGSSRLPGKSLMPLGGVPLLRHVLTRALAIPELDGVVLATSHSEKDKALVQLARDLGVMAIQGSEHDVIDRFMAVVRLTQATDVMRLTGDCPLLCVDVAYKVVRAYKKWRQHYSGALYVTNDTLISGYPDGTDVEIFSAEALRLANMKSLAGADREHVTPWMRREVRTMVVHSDRGGLKHKKWSVDTKEDLDWVRRVWGYLPSTGPNRFNLAETAAAAQRAGDDLASTRRS